GNGGERAGGQSLVDVPQQPPSPPPQMLNDPRRNLPLPKALELTIRTLAPEHDSLYLLPNCRRSPPHPSAAAALG
ncbi:hypothetical protein TNCT_92221, partial [Trichonephila clavata]